MKVSLNWLKNYVDYGDLTPEQLAEKITKSGIEVDGIEYIVSEKSQNVVVGYVKECEQHPDADKLKFCQVDVGESELLQIVCGAPNVAQGQKVVVAKPGGVLPGNFKIKKVKLRGVESNGMICSMKELGVGEQFIPTQYEEGIIELPQEATVGEGVDDLLNLNDAVLEFDLTPNRADALSMMGVAYEVAAILNVAVHLPEPEVETTAKAADDFVTVTVEDQDMCPYYGAFVIEDVELTSSPLWMQNYLLAAGTRPINNVVDITNYVLLEYGQALHAFDYDLVGTNEIVVRRAKNQETIVTLDDKERTLTDENLLITNGKEGIALAGVMGGAHTEVYAGTNTVLLEAAYFDSQAVRKTVNDTGLRSEASTRFEKGVDPNRVKAAGERACELLVQYANGKVAKGTAEFDALNRSEHTVGMNAKEINRRLGTNITVNEMERILEKLRFGFSRIEDDFIVTIPTRRGDVAIFEDMLEEIARIYGYDFLPYTLPANAQKAGGLTDRQYLQRRMKQYLEGAGLSETITYSLLHERDVSTFVSPEQSDKLVPVALKMPMTEDHRFLRMSLVPELLARLTYNVARKEQNVALYDMASVFLSEETDLTEQPKEQLRLAGALTGDWLSHAWQGEVKPVDFYVVKGLLEGLFQFINRSFTLEQTKMENMHPGRTALIKVDNRTVGFIGQIHPLYAKEHDLKETYAFDLDMEYILDTTELETHYEAVTKYPVVLRDVAFVVDKSVVAGDIQQKMLAVGAPLVKNVTAFDVYEGENLPDNEKSVAYTISFQDVSKTLTDEEVDTVFNEVIETVNETFEAYVRT